MNLVITVFQVWENCGKGEGLDCPAGFIVGAVGLGCFYSVGIQDMNSPISLVCSSVKMKRLP